MTIKEPCHGRGKKEPYKIWISEIILQQTRVAQGLSYYNNFIKEFPTIKTLANAADEAVFKAWEGLGYYSRCRNILFTARNIENNLGGNFPKTYANILALKGIGPYTAAAISSFAYGLPHAVVDGNVLRVLARYFGETVPIDSVKGKAQLTDLANELLFAEDPAAYNQAIMDFGATVCKPKQPECNSCPLSTNCVAYRRQLVATLPVKEKELVKRNRWFTYFIFVLGETVLINKRINSDIWQNLYEFYVVETGSAINWEQRKIKKWLLTELNVTDFSTKHISEVYKQQLTHQNLEGKFITISLPYMPASLEGFRWVKKKELQEVAFPRLINRYLQQEKSFF